MNGRIIQLQCGSWPWKALLLPIKRGKSSIHEVGFCITASRYVHRIISCVYGAILITATAVAASMISRTGMMWFLYQCFGINNMKAKRILIACAIIQIVVNSFTILQIVLQCGPNPYRLVSAMDPTCYSFRLIPCLGRPHKVFSLHVGSPPYRWLSHLPRSFSPGRNWFHPRCL